MADTLVQLKDSFTKIAKFEVASGKLRCFSTGPDLHPASRDPRRRPQPDRASGQRLATDLAAGRLQALAPRLRGCQEGDLLVGRGLQLAEDHEVSNKKLFIGNQ